MADSPCKCLAPQGASFGGAPADPARRQWLLATTALGGAAVAVTAIPFVSSMLPSARAQAAGAPVEVDIGKLAPGELLTVEWRGKPVWILRRTPAMLESLKAAEPMLVDPVSAHSNQPAYARNPWRSRNREVAVLVGICTHLGCSPSEKFAAGAVSGLGPDWPGGFLCPCHGSTFDLAGRVFRNKPAPTNLDVPPYRYLAENRLLIGADEQEKG